LFAFKLNCEFNDSLAEVKVPTQKKVFRICFKKFERPKNTSLAVLWSFVLFSTKEEDSNKET
jgi:hypothetical protein